MKIIKKILRWIVIVCIALIIVILICTAIGTIVDTANDAKFQRLAQQALDDLNATQRIGDDNAWNDYKIALDMLGELRLSVELNNYVRGGKRIIPEIEKELKDHSAIINAAIKGTKKPFCSVPVKYQEGMTAEIPSLTGLLAVAKLLIAQAQCHIDNGRIDDGVEHFRHAIIYSGHVINGSPLLINFMIGIASNKLSLNTLSRYIAGGRFNRTQLARIERFLSDQEDGLPAFHYAIESETNAMAISLAKVRNPITAMSEKEDFLSDIMVRLLCWRQLFSPRLAALQAIEFHRRIRDSIAKQERAFLTHIPERRILSGILTRSDHRDAISKNLFIKLSTPNYEAMLARKLELVAMIRMTRLAAAIQSYYLANRRLPVSLGGFDPALTLDPFVGRSWRLSVEGDSLILHSPGRNSELPDDDLIMVLHR